jgi:hypothetical protein
LEDGPPSFTQDYTCPALLGMPLGAVCVDLPGCHRLWRAVPGRFGLASCSHVAVPQPQSCKHGWFGLARFRSPLLSGSRLLSLPPGTEMFQFPGLASLLREMTALRPPGYPIRRSWDHSLFAAPPGLSQLTTSFIASLCQGIHRAPLHA